MANTTKVSNEIVFNHNFNTSNNAEIEVHEVKNISNITTGYGLSSDSTILKADVKRFEKQFNCKFKYVSPYQKHSGAYWVHLHFTK